MSDGPENSPTVERGILPLDFCSRRGGLTVAAVLALIGALFGLLSLQLTFGNLDLPGPGFLPFALGLLLIALAIAICISAFREPRDAPRVELAHAPVVIAYAGLVATAFFFERLGAFLTLGAFTVIMLVFVARVRIIPALLSSVIAMLAIWYVFKVLLGVQLPAGPLAGLL